MYLEHVIIEHSSKRHVIMENKSIDHIVYV